jgi:hypothetical protein
LFKNVAVYNNSGLMVIRYAPNAHGTSEITLRATDSGGLYVEDTFTVVVDPVNDVPVGMREQYAVRGDEVLVVDDPGVLKNDKDVDGDRLFADVVRDPRHGQLVLDKDGSFVYRPDPSFVGTDTFIYRVVDEKGAWDNVRVNIVVSAPISPIDPISDPSGDPANEPPLPDGGDPLSDFSLDQGLLEAEMPKTTDGQQDEAEARLRDRGNLDDDRTSTAEQSIDAEFGQFSVDTEGTSNVRGLTRTRSTDEDVYEPLRMPTVGDIIDPGTMAIDTTTMYGDLDDLSDLLDDEDVFHRLMIGSAVGLTGLTVGYVFWTVRAGYLLTGLIAQVPAWRFVDPLPILNSLDAGAAIADGESLESIIASGDGSVS